MLQDTRKQVVAIVTDWFDIIRKKSKPRRRKGAKSSKKKLRRRKQKKNLKQGQQALVEWTDEEWGSAEQHSAKEKGKKAPSKTKGRYMPKATYKRTPKSRLKYQDKKKKEGRKKGKQNVPTGKKFSQK